MVSFDVARTPFSDGETIPLFLPPCPCQRPLRNTLQVVVCPERRPTNQGRVCRRPAGRTNGHIHGCMINVRNARVAIGPGAFHSD